MEGEDSGVQSVQWEDSEVLSGECSVQGAKRGLWSVTCRM